MFCFVLLCCISFGIISKESLRRPLFWRISLCFILGFSQNQLLLLSFNPFQVGIFLYSARWGSNFTLPHVNICFSPHHLLQRPTFPYCVFMAPLSKPHIFGFIFDSSILLHMSIYLLLCWQHTVLIYHSFVIYFEIRKCDASIFFSYLKIALSILYCSWIWNIFSFSWLQMMLTLGLAYIIWGSFPVFPLPLEFLNGYWILAKAFSTSSEMIVWFLFFSLLMCMDLQILKNPHTPGISPTRSWCMILLLLDLIC